MLLAPTLSWQLSFTLERKSNESLIKFENPKKKIRPLGLGSGLSDALCNEKSSPEAQVTVKRPHQTKFENLANSNFQQSQTRDNNSQLNAFYLPWRATVDPKQWKRVPQFESQQSR